MNVRAALSLAALVVLLLSSGCGGQDQATSHPSGITSQGLFPPFDQGKSSYVSRCGRGAAPIEITAPSGTRVSVGSRHDLSGSISIRTATVPGSDFPFEVISHGRSRTYRVRCLPPDFPAWRWNSRGHIRLGETERWWHNVLSNPRRRLHARQTFDPVHINLIDPRGRREGAGDLAPIASPG